MHQPPLILVVDDDPQLQELYEAELTRGGFAYARAMNGDECLAIAREQKPDLILLDILMPGMSGGEVLAKLKVSSALKEIPVIVLSSLLDRPGNVPFARESGAVDFIRKDISPEELLKRIMVALKM